MSAAVDADASEPEPLTTRNLGSLGIPTFGRSIKELNDELLEGRVLALEGDSVRALPSALAFERDLTLMVGDTGTYGVRSGVE